MLITISATLIAIGAATLGWIVKALIDIIRDIESLKGDHKALSQSIKPMAEDLNMIKKHLIPPTSQN